MNEFHPLIQATMPGIFLGQFQSGLRNIHTPYFGGWHLIGKSQRDAAGTGGHVKYSQRSVQLSCFFDLLQNRFHQNLRLGPRNEGIRRNHQIQTVKTNGPHQMLKRDTLGTSIHQGLKPAHLVACYR